MLGIASVDESISGGSRCQVPAVSGSVFECQAPSSEGVYGKIEYPCPVKKKYASGQFKSVFVNGSLVSSFIPYDGSLCEGCQWAAFSRKDSLSPLLVLNSSQSAENKRHKVRRFIVRAMRGVVCGISKGYRFRWFVLTESDAAIALGIDFGIEFHKFLRWLRYYCPDFQYIVVEHRQGRKRRRNWHIISYGSDRLPVLAMREYWMKHFKSTVTGMAEVKDIDKAMKYLCEYLAEEHKFVRSWCSQGWVFRGWLGVCKEYHKRFGDYPSEGDLSRLSSMGKCIRGYRIMWLLESGYLCEDDLFKAKEALKDSVRDNGLVEVIKAVYGGLKV